jgi:hypothetical protein
VYVSFSFILLLKKFWLPSDKSGFFSDVFIYLSSSIQLLVKSAGEKVIPILNVSANLTYQRNFLEGFVTVVVTLVHFCCVVRSIAILNLYVGLERVRSDS